MKWLVTGGAGYIGAHIVAALCADGVDVVVLDDLSSGLRRRVPAEVPFVLGDVGDHDQVLATLREHRIDGVIHLAARKAVAESIDQPLLYYRANVAGFERLLAAMSQAGIGKLVHSSSASVIGTPTEQFVDETAATRPESPYGRTKLMCEWILQDLAHAEGWDYVNLRYFNVAGAGSPLLGDVGVFNLIPLVFRAIERGIAPQLFGDDYPTSDGSCVRDFVHVVDLARAHVAAVRRLEQGRPYRETLNVGRGQGVSVKEVMAVVRDVTGAAVDFEVVGRRPGDPAQVVGDVRKIAREFGWHAQLDVVDMVRSAWQAWKAADAELPAPDSAE
jgi:UDP-glucose 4-epimerase